MRFLKLQIDRMVQNLSGIIQCIYIYCCCFSFFFRLMKHWMLKPYSETASLWWDRYVAIKILFVYFARKFIRFSQNLDIWSMMLWATTIRLSLLHIKNTQKKLTFLVNTYINWHFFLWHVGPSWSWPCGSWIYNYLCYQCLSPLK
jgi:hypothetical protein